MSEGELTGWFGRLMCRLGLHHWNYSGFAHSHAPAPIRCYRCWKRM